MGFSLLLPLVVLLANVQPTKPVGDDDFLLSPKGINSDVAALVEVKSKLTDDMGVMDSWDINSVDACTWSMIGCSSEGFVISLEMAGKLLSGWLSPSIGNLSHLQYLLLQHNQITGSIPPEIGKLKDLRTLDLSHNQLIGEIPNSMGNLTQLDYLRLGSNNLSGPIPEAVAHLAGLSILDLSFNNLSGPTPKILARAYGITGNSFLCNSSAFVACIDSPLLINGTMTSKKPKSTNIVIMISLSVGCALIVFILLFVCWLHCGTLCLPPTSHDQVHDTFLGNVKRFSLRELQVATNNFDPKNILGQGGYGMVYKGKLKNGMLVAVKRLKDPSFTGEVQFQTEVELIGLAVHRNLLRLYGFCLTRDERLLVYPYMANGSVADCLRDRSSKKLLLDWGKRMQIALGSARGLQYLHEQCNPKIIHRDVKAANILLDECFEAVVGDFGLAKLLDHTDSHVSTAVRGTVGHIAPEYLSTGQSSEKTDVFSFGILLLELIMGQYSKRANIDWVRKAKEGQMLQTLIDRDLKASFHPGSLEKAVDVVLSCTLSNPLLRPKMSDVVRMLETGLEVHGNMEESQGMLLHSGRLARISGNFHDIYEASSFNVEAIELSGPR